MRNFPVPYPDELVYSLVARAGVRSAITSPKLLLGEVFGDRKVIATLDLPNHLIAISKLLVNTGKYDVPQLIYEHTMFPIYAPFVNENIRLKAMARMERFSQGSVHLMLGAAASIVKMSDTLRSCPVCVAEQEQKYGESYWSRLWFLPSLPYCPAHGLLNQSIISSRDHRHTYHACARVFCAPPLSNEKGKTEQQLYLTQKAQELLHLPSQESPTNEQWSRFYNHLAQDFGCAKGVKQVSHDKVADLVVSKITIPELRVDLDRDTNWLRTIFRHHRKAFSYLQHFTIWSAFVPDMTVGEIIKEVKTKEKVSETVQKCYVQASLKECKDKRERWKSLTSSTSIKLARTHSDGGALYAWLYRNDRDWLLAFNRQKQTQSVARKNRVDWGARDRALTKQLLRVLERLDNNVEGPRRSQNYLLKQLKHSNSVAKKLYLLPMLASALNRYQESVVEFQARRLAMTVIKQSKAGAVISRWQLMRSANLPKERILPIVDNLLDWIVMESNIK
ncbi:TPA: TnsD family Tn7-like transposition protein [Vibrio parahaemolyticus]